MDKTTEEFIVPEHPEPRTDEDGAIKLDEYPIDHCAYCGRGVNQRTANTQTCPGCGYFLPTAGLADEIEVTDEQG